MRKGVEEMFLSFVAFLNQVCFIQLRGLIVNTKRHHRISSTHMEQGCAGQWQTDS